jgi:ADP-ribose pyrophosphatase YjhB (NUDIX family)
MGRSPGLPQWLEWARQLQSLSQTGLAYATDVYDVERYRALRALAAEIVAAHSDAEPEYIRGLFERDVGHATPKVDVRAAVFQGGKVLLVRERSDGGWTLPGGWADPGEPPSRAVAREVLEESGYTVRAVRLLAVLDRDRHPHPPLPYHVYKLFFECEVLREGRLSQNLETDDVAFFDERELPPLSLARVTPGQMARLFDLHRHPELPADFD